MSSLQREEYLEIQGAVPKHSHFLTAKKQDPES